MNCTAMIIPNELVPYVTSIVNMHHNKSIAATMPSWLQSMPAAPIHQLQPMLPVPIHQLQPMQPKSYDKKISVYSNDICYIKCFNEQCTKAHYPSIKCKNGSSCNRFRNNTCAFVHDEQRKYMDFLPDNTFNLLEGWERSIPQWINTLNGRRTHFGAEPIPLQRSNAIGITDTTHDILRSAIRPYEDMQYEDRRYYEDRGRARSRSRERNYNIERR
jgi:hypothetical protein